MIIIGSARIDENGRLSGGKEGDQTGKEVSTQPFYLHSKGWVIIRAEENKVANSLAYCMGYACANNNIGYDQSNRLAIIKDRITSKVKTECDCSSLVRACCIQSGIDVGNFTTLNAKEVLLSTKKFNAIEFKNQGDLMNGDILCTKTKGHIVIVVSGAKDRTKVEKPSIPYPTLKKGMKNADVKLLQACLNRLGYNLVEDGDFGNKTFTCLKDFQKKNRLVNDGIYGIKSYARMCEVIQ